MTVEPLKFDKETVCASGQSIVVSGHMTNSDGLLPARGDVSASTAMAGDGRWLLNRALVQPPEYRGRGLGTRLLLTLLAEISKRADFKQLIVEPGGYNMPVRRQRRFYTKQGFKLIPGHPGVYRWVRPAKGRHVTA